MVEQTAEDAGPRRITNVEEIPLVLALRAEIERLKAEHFARVTSDMQALAERDLALSTEKLKWLDRVTSLQDRVNDLQGRLLALREKANEPL